MIGESFRSAAPFGPPALASRCRTTMVSAGECAGPLGFFQRLAETGEGSGAALMESAAQGAPAGIRSLVLPRAVLRLVVRRGQAIYSLLEPDALPILEALEDRLRKDSGLCVREVTRLDRGRLRARFLGEREDPALPDEQRLRAPSVLDAVRVLAGLVGDEEPSSPPPGLYGAFSYELVDQWEELPPRRPDPFDEPDLHLVFALDAVVFDHLRREVRVVTRSLSPSDAGGEESRHSSYLQALQDGDRPAGTGLTPEGARPAILFPEALPDVPEEHFLSGARKFLDHIRAGDIFQAVLSRGMRMPSGASPLSVYRVLRERNPSPYMFYLDLDDGVLLGASPETSVKVEAGEVEIRPIAGTAPRGFLPDGSLDPELDSRLAVGLLLDRKEQAEHAMLVDLARNDVARVSVSGTRRVVDPFSIEKYSHVQHLVSRVRGTLRPDLDALHAYRAAANLGTLTGAPKLRAMELIRETEPFSRGFYGGAVGYLLRDGTFDSCIVIRSLRYREGVYFTRAGAGIVADSIPERELEETLHKSLACRQAVALAERGER